MLTYQTIATTTQNLSLSNFSVRHKSYPIIQEKQVTWGCQELSGINECDRKVQKVFSFQICHSGDYYCAHYHCGYELHEKEVCLVSNSYNEAKVGC